MLEDIKTEIKQATQIRNRVQNDCEFIWYRASYTKLAISSSATQILGLSREKMLHSTSYSVDIFINTNTHGLILKIHNNPKTGCFKLSKTAIGSKSIHDSMIQYGYRPFQHCERLIPVSWSRDIKEDCWYVKFDLSGRK